MARVGLIQANFAAGELSPRLHGRVDLARYQSGAATLENFIVRPEGGLIRRPGTRFAGAAKSASNVTRLIPFQFSDTQAYILEFGDFYMRVWMNHAPVTLTPQAITGITKANPAVLTYTGADTFANTDHVLISGVTGMVEVNNREFTVAGVNTGANTFQLSGINSTAFTTFSAGGTVAEIYEIASPYAVADLPELSFAQSADVLYLRHSSYDRYKLSRTGHTSWTFSIDSAAKGPFASLNTDDSQRVRFTGSSTRVGSSLTMYANTALFTTDHVGNYFRVQEIYLDQLAVSPWAAGQAAPGVGGQVSNAGNVYERLTGGPGGAMGTIAPVHTQGNAYDNPTTATDARLWRYLHSRWAIVLITAYTSTTQVTVQVVTYVPNGLLQPNQNITGAASSGGKIRITCTAHGYGDGDYVNISSVGGVSAANGNWKINYINANTFDLDGSTFSGSYTSGGVVVRYATWLWQYGAYSPARGFPSALTFHEQRLIEAGSTAAPSALHGSKSGDYGNFLPGTGLDDEAIDYTIAANQVPNIRWLASVDQGLIVGTQNMEFLGVGGQPGEAMTPARARFVPESSEGSCFQVPVNLGSEVLFINRSQRKIISLSTSDAGTNFNETDLTKLVDHFTTGGKTILFAAWQSAPLRNLWLVRSDGVLLCLTYDPKEQVIGWSRQIIGGTNVVVESAAVIATPDGTSDELWVSVQRTINGSAVRHIEYLSQPFEPSSSSDLTSQPFMDAALEYSGSSTTALSGLFHLAGETVSILAGSTPVLTKTVTSTGKLTLDTAVTHAWVGLANQCYLKTLRLEGGEPVTAQGKTKRIPEITVRVLNALGGLVGETDGLNFEALVPSSATTLQSDDFTVRPSTDYGLAGQIIIKSSDPLPLDILAVMPLVTVGEP